MRRVRIALILPACLALVAACPALAGAQTEAPPGVSEVDQYTETLPGPGGNETLDRPDGGAAGGGDPDGGGPEQPILAPETVQELERLGPEGRATAELAATTAPRGDRGSNPALAAGGHDSGSPSGVGALVDALSGSDGEGMGILLPLILLAVAAAGIGFAVLRSRAGQTS
jgi:hypothetical protein